MDFMYKLPVLLVLGFIVFSLGQGMYFLAKDDGDVDKTRVVKALTVRIVLSITLFWPARPRSTSRGTRAPRHVTEEIRKGLRPPGSRIVPPRRRRGVFVAFYNQ